MCSHRRRALQKSGAVRIWYPLLLACRGRERLVGGGGGCRRRRSRTRHCSIEEVVICVVWMRRGVLCAVGTPIGDVQRGPITRMCTCIDSQTGGRVEGRM